MPELLRKVSLFCYELQGDGPSALVRTQTGVTATSAVSMAGGVTQAVGGHSLAVGRDLWFLKAMTCPEVVLMAHH